MKNVPIKEFDERWAGRRAEQPDRDQQPEGLPGAALRPAPRPDHHRPAQLSRARTPSAIRRSESSAATSSTGCFPRPRCRLSTAGAPSTAAIRRPEIRFNDAHVPNPQRSAPPQTILGAEQKAWFKDKLEQLDRDVEDLGQLAGRARLARRPAEPARRVSPRSRGPRTRYASIGGGDYGTAYAERAEIYDLVRDAKITGFAIVSGDRHSFWAGYATAELPPGKFEPVGLSFVGASLVSPGAMEAYEHSLPKDAPLRAAVSRRQAGRRRSRTGPSTCC